LATSRCTAPWLACTWDLSLAKRLAQVPFDAIPSSKENSAFRTTVKIKFPTDWLTVDTTAAPFFGTGEYVDPA